jgi:PAS domain S-box-containing protein
MILSRTGKVFVNLVNKPFFEKFFPASLFIGGSLLFYYISLKYNDTSYLVSGLIMTSLISIVAALYLHLLKDLNVIIQKTKDDVAVNYELRAKQLAENLELSVRSEQQIRAIMDAIPGLVSWVDKNLHYQGINSELCKFMRKKPEEVIGKPVGSFMDFAENPIPDMIEKHFQSPQKRFSGYTSINVNGDIRHFLITMQKFLADSMMVVVSVDITEQKRLEEEILATRARAINSEKMSSLGEMAASIAHEINNPLTIIHGRLQKILYMADGKQPLQTSELKEQVQKIADRVDKISKIIKSLRTLSRDGSKDAYVKTRVADLISETLELSQTRLKYDGIELKLIPFDENAFHVECSATQITQVLLNLVNNAHDAIKNLKVKWIEIAVTDTDLYIEISVTDSGAGIPAVIKDKIMQPFFTTKDVGHGTGLGLSLSKSIIDSHKGFLLIDDNCPHTKFTILLPKKTF